MKIIAELCQNHNGKKEILDTMIKEASESGATHVKIQHIKPSYLNFRPRHEKGININNTQYSIMRPFADEYKRLSKLTLSEDLIRKVKPQAKKDSQIED